MMTTVHGDGPDTAGGRIVVVDDNFVNATLIAHLVARHGFAVETLGSGQEAVHRSSAGGIDGMILDLHMPDMDGFDTARAIRAGESSSAFRLPIVAVTADLRPELRVRALAAGMDDLLIKPVSVAAVAILAERHFPVLPRQGGVRESSGRLPICRPAFEPTGLLQAEAASPGSASRRLGVFITELAGLDMTLPSLVSRNGFLEAQRLVHQSKTHASSIGALHLSQVLSDLEGGLRAGDTVRCQRILRVLRAACDQFRTAVRSEGLVWDPPAVNAVAAQGSAARPG